VTLRGTDLWFNATRKSFDSLTGKFKLLSHGTLESMGSVFEDLEDAGALWMVGFKSAHRHILAYAKEVKKLEGLGLFSRHPFATYGYETLYFYKIKHV
jgi:hypothetical protein